RIATCDNFTANLCDICRVARRAGVRTVLSTVAVNLKDQPPLGSLHRKGLTEAVTAAWDEAYAAGTADEDRRQFESAIDHYQAALAIDDHFSDLHFRLARCYLASLQFDKAREHYQLACDWDAMPFRADQRLNRAIRELAHDAAADVRLADAEQALAACPASDHGIPGEALFYEHVHFRFTGNYEVAKALLPAVSTAVAEVLKRPLPTAVEVPSRDDCAAQLALTPFDECLLLGPTVELTSRPPFTNELEHAQRQQKAQRCVAELQARLDRDAAQQALAVYRRAIQRRAEDWHLHLRYAYMLANVGNHAAAAAEYRTVLAHVPWHPDARSGLRQSLVAAADPRAAKARSDNADSSPQVEPRAMSHYNLGQALLRQNDPAAAIEHFRRAADLKQCPPQALGEFAWLLTTLPDNRLRNGKEAVVYAEEACRQTDRKSPELLDILAAALAETGRYEDAVRTAGEALEVALASNRGPNQNQLVEKIRQLLELYQRHRTVCQAR
ncbi:MAG: tetratricopeptide repeat protein, partial [Tepidisphaeraceae bacterium]